MVKKLKLLQPIRVLNKNRRQHTDISANVNFPEITGGHASKHMKSCLAAERGELNFPS